MDFERYLTHGELSALAETNQWLDKEQSGFKKMMGFTRKPLEYVYNKVPESVRESIASAILKVLVSVRDGTTGWSVSPPENPEMVFSQGVRNLDKTALDLVGRSKNACTAEGAVTGVAGLAGIVVDIPALYGLLFRMIAQVAGCYGFEVESEGERVHMLKVLEIGHQLEPADKKRGMAQIVELEEMMRRNVPVVEVQRFAVQKGLQTMARHLGLALTQRKLAQSVVLVGGVIGAGVNRQMAGEVGEVAYHVYRRRHLMEVALRRASGQLKIPSGAPPGTTPSTPRVRLPAPPSYD